MIEHKMRRSDRLADEETAKQILLRGEYGVLSTVGEDGFSYGVPINYVFSGDKIFFHCAKDAGHKQENISHNSKVCFTVVCDAEVVSQKFTSKYKSAIVFGNIKKAVSGKEFALEELIKKYSPDFISEGKSEIRKAINAVDIYEITILKLSAKVHL